MAEGRRRDAWDRTATVLCLTANINRAKGSRAYKPADFHPFHQRSKAVEVDNKTAFSQLKKLFIRK